MKHLLAAATLTAATFAHAQHAPVADYDIGPVPTVPDTVRTMKEAEVVLRYTAMYDRMEEGNEVNEYHLMHVTTFLRDNTAIEANNKVYLSLNQVQRVVSIKARTIMPDGSVIDLKDEDFKQAQDEEKKESFLYFAFEGLVPGAVTDYVCVTKRSPDLRGDRCMLQFTAPVLQERFDLIGPARLVMATKCLNGAPVLKADSTDDDLQHLYCELRNVPGVEDEPSSAPTAHRMQVIFQLDRVPDANIKDYSGYVNATKIYHSVVYPTIEPKTKKSLAALLKSAGVAFARDEEDKVRTLEQYVKSNFAISPSGEHTRELDHILKTHTCDQTGMCILFCALLNEMGEEHQLVVTSDRTSLPMDPKFESFIYLQDVVLYLPTLKKYLAPTEFTMRLGWIPSEDMDNNGLFIRNYDLGGTMTGVGKLGHIDALPDSVNGHDIYTKVQLSADAASATVDMENRLTGYFANGIQPYYGLMNEERRTEVLNDLVGFITDNSTTHEVSVENGEGALTGVKPLILHAKATTSKFSGSAGDKMLFNIGELIGPQVEMYTKDTRKLPVDDDYNRRFHRELEVTIPAGWTVQNGADLAMDQHLDIDGRRVLQFVSTWHMEGNTLKVNIDENYRQCQLPLELYEPYRKVVNAAADWNKLKLVLVKG